jgi:hypothetical protein
MLQRPMVRHTLPPPWPIEGVFGIARGTATIDQFGGDQLHQSVVELRLWHRRNGGNQLV